ncbi:endonuclease domain-containing protein [Allosphingosinicella deserti]
MSLPEVLLWRELRKRPAGLKFRRQHPAGPFVLDFVCLSSRVAIEIDGQMHDAASAQFRDEVRDEWLADQGFSTLRIAARDVFPNLEGVLKLVTSRCSSEQPLHHAATRRGPPPRTGEDT